MLKTENNESISPDDSSRELIAISRGLNAVGTILLISALFFWFSSSVTGMHFYLQAELLLPASIAIIQFPFILEPRSSSKLYLAHSNLLSTIGIISLPFHVDSSLFLIAGLAMAFFAFFVKGLKEAKNTEFIWSNILIALGSYYVITGNFIIGTPIQIVGLALTSYTLTRTRQFHFLNETFDNTSFILLSLWAWGLSLSIIYWLVITDYYSGFSFLVQGILLMVAVSRLYHGIWPIYTKNLLRQELK